MHRTPAVRNEEIRSVTGKQVMNILFILNIGFDKGGPSVHLLTDVIEEALRQNHKCHVVLKKTTEGETTGLEDLTAQYPNLTVSLVPQLQTQKAGFVKRYILDCKYAYACRRHYRSGQYDAVFLQSCNVGWVHMKCLRALHAPVLFNVQDIFPQNLMFSAQLPLAGITYPLFCRLQRFAYKKAEQIITISEDMKQTLVEEGIDANKIKVVYNWSYSDGVIRKEDIPKKRFFDLKTDEHVLNVVYAGNIGKMQNVELLAKTAAVSAHDPEIHYYIIGDGANKKQVEALTAGLPNVTTLPMQASAFAESIYAQADVNMIPLAKGGIKTALPSKTATVLRTNSHTVFCIDAGSRFEEIIKDIHNAYVADNTNPQSLYQILCSLKNVKANFENDTRNLTLFSRKNACKYVEELTKLCQLRSIQVR